MCLGEERAKLDASVTCALNHCSIRVSVIETTKPEKVLKHQQSLKQAMIDLRSEQELDDVLLMVIDILQVTSSHLPLPSSACLVDAQLPAGARHLHLLLTLRVRVGRTSVGV